MNRYLEKIAEGGKTRGPESGFWFQSLDNKSDDMIGGFGKKGPYPIRDDARREKLVSNISDISKKGVVHNGSKIRVGMSHHGTFVEIHGVEKDVAGRVSPGVIYHPHTRGPLTHEEALKKIHTAFGEIGRTPHPEFEKELKTAMDGAKSLYHKRLFKRFGPLAAGGALLAGVGAYALTRD